MTIVRGRNEALTELVERAVKTIKYKKKANNAGCATAFFTLDAGTVARLSKKEGGSLEKFTYERQPQVFFSRGSSRSCVSIEHARDNIQSFLENIDRLVKNLDRIDRDQPIRGNRNSQRVRNGFISMANRASERVGQCASFITNAVAKMGHTRSRDIVPVERMFEQFLCMIHKAATGIAGTCKVPENLQEKIRNVTETQSAGWNTWRWEVINGLINQCRNLVQNGHARLMELAALTTQMGRASGAGIGNARRIITNCAEPMAIDFISSFQDRKRLVAVAYDLDGEYIKDPCENCREWILEGGSMGKLNSYIGGMIVGRREKDKPGDTLRFVSTLEEFRAVEAARDA